MATEAVRHGTRFISYYAGTWTGTDYKTLTSRYFEYGWQAMAWMRRGDMDRER